jgi:hypothetical protein
MAEALQKPEIFAADEYLKSIFQKAFMNLKLKPGRHGWSAIKSWESKISKSVAPLFIMWMLEDVTRDKIKKFRERNKFKNRLKLYLLFKGDLPSRAVADRIAWLDIRDDKRMHFVVTKKEDEETFAERLLTALDISENDERILDAWWEKDIFVVVSPSIEGFKKLHVPLGKLPSLKEFSNKKLSSYEIDEDGIFVYWPDFDVHLGWEQFEQAVDEKAVFKAKQESAEFNKCYGTAIKSLRKKNKLRQSDINGLTARQIGRIERGECRAMYKALSKLAKSHNMNISDYMDELSKLL